MSEAEAVSPPLARGRDGEGGSDALSERVRSLRLPPRSTQRGSNTALPWILTVLLAISTGFLGFREWQHSLSAAPEETETSAGPQSDVPRSTTSGASTNAALPAAGDGSGIALQVQGYIVPTHQILVSPKVSGMVTKLFVEEGMRVQKGQVLAELEKTDYLADLDRAKAQLDLSLSRQRLLLAGTREEELRQVQAELTEAQASLQQLKNEHERNTDLRQQDRTLVSDSMFEESQSQYLAAQQRVERLTAKKDQAVNGARKQELEAAQAEVDQSRAELVKANWRLSNTTILAPISGTVLKKNAEEGNIVNPVAFNGSFSVCDLADLSDLEVDLNVDESDISKVFVKQACRVLTKAFPDRVYYGYVDRLMPIADRAQQAIPVRVKVRVPKEEEGIYLKPEMSAVVTFLSKPFDESVKSPEIKGAASNGGAEE